MRQFTGGQTRSHCNHLFTGSSTLATNVLVSSCVTMQSNMNRIFDHYENLLLEYATNTQKVGSL